MGSKARKTRKFAEVKRMLNPKDLKSKQCAHLSPIYLEGCTLRCQDPYLDYFEDHGDESYAVRMHFLSLCQLCPQWPVLTD